MSTDTDVSPIIPRVVVDAVPRRVVRQESAYDRVFWLTYLSNGLTTVANAMLVRYADFVDVLGGEERQLGLIVGVGMLGSIAMRLVQGLGIDRYGAGRIWQLSAALYVASLMAHLALSTAYGPGIFIVRAVMQTSLAGIFGSSITFVSLRVSPQRIAEMVGTLGTSGFLGMLIGPQLSDWICGGTGGEGRVQLMFVTAAGIAALATLATWLATVGDPPPNVRRRPSVWRMVRRYTPLTVALVAAGMGAGFAIPMTFLRPFAAELGVNRIGLFFGVYAATAFAARLATRQLFERHGNRPWILLGLVLLTVSFLLYIPVRASWQLAAPGAVAGVAHALLFPSVMSAGTIVFPRRFRGVATSVMLAMFDCGTFLGAPVVGACVHHLRDESLAAYPVMFAGAAAVLLAMTLTFWLGGPRDTERV
jgi:MFS family permease